ncbi:hypothetical protein Tco_0371848 [Tanacetum coccineum]
MQRQMKYILKQQFEGFSVSNSEGLHKGYDRFQSLLSQLEIYGAGVSTEDANKKFLRSLPSSWSQVSLVMRTKPGVDSLSIDDLYNNLRVYHLPVHRMSPLFLVKALAWGPHLYIMIDLELLDGFLDLEEMDFEMGKWPMISMRLKKVLTRKETHLESVLCGTSVVEPNVVSQPKVWPDAPMIKEYESGNDDEYVIQPSKEQERPSFAFIDTVKHVKLLGKLLKNKTHIVLVLKLTRKTGIGLMSIRLKVWSWGKNRPVRNNVQRLNHQNKFVPTTVLTRTGRIPVNTASHNLNSQAVSTRQDWKYKATLLHIMTIHGGPFIAFGGSSKVYNNCLPDEHQSLESLDTTICNVSTLENIVLLEVQNEANHSAGTQDDNIDAEEGGKSKEIFMKWGCCILLKTTLYCKYGPFIILSVKKLEAKRMKELERLKSQEKEANDAAKALRKEFAQDTKDLLLQAGADRATNLPYGKKAIGTKWVYRNKKDERGVVVRNKARSLLPRDIARGWDKTYDEFIRLDVKGGLICMAKLMRRSHVSSTSRDKYVADILKKFDFTCLKTASTPIDTQKSLTKDEEAADVDVTPKTSHLNAVKRIFRRLISWQCKKQTIVATSTTEAEYVAAANCYGQDGFVAWIRKGVKYSGKVTPLFDSMLVPYQALEGEGSEQPTEPQPTPAPITLAYRRPTLPLSGDHTSEKAEGGLNLEELFVLCTNLSNRVLALETSKDAQAAEILKLKDQIKKLKRKYITIAQSLMEDEKKEELGKRRCQLLNDIEDSSRLQASTEKERSILLEGGKKRAKFLRFETLAAQRKFRATQRSAEIRSRPPTKSQLRNLMMTYLKNMGSYKHSQLKAKTFAEIQESKNGSKDKGTDVDLLKWNINKCFSEDSSKMQKDMEQSASTTESLDLMEVLGGLKPFLKCEDVPTHKKRTPFDRMLFFGRLSSWRLQVKMLYTLPLVSSKRQIDELSWEVMMEYCQYIVSTASLVSAVSSKLVLLATPPFLQIASETNLGYYFKGGLEGDEEGLVDVLFKLESSYGENLQDEMMDMMDISNEIQEYLGKSYIVRDDIDENELLGVPPVFVDPDPPVLFESALVFSYFSMALATRLSTIFLTDFFLNLLGGMILETYVYNSLRICKGMQSYGI